MRVAFVVGPDANVMDIAGSWEVFQDTNIEGRARAFVTEIVSDTTDPIVVGGGLVIQPNFTYDMLPVAPNVIVMGRKPNIRPQSSIGFARPAPRPISRCRFASAPSC